ncbi:MAG: glycosyltransferase [Clostridia bacterium]|nr:glycosyltransferase [Clostridia bacterium]
MKIAFCSNYFNHHQEAMSKALYNLSDGNFRFVARCTVGEERLRLGYEDMNKKYDFILRPYESEAQKKEALSWAIDCDVMIFGSGDEALFEKRMEKNGLTFRYLERPFKKGTWRRLVPRTKKTIYESYVKYKNNNLYILCSSAYTASDLSLCGFPPEKCFKWGYFPEVKEHDIEALLSKKTPRSILWVGRFIDWKHPEAPVKMAEKLKKNGKDFHLTMIGDGVEKPRIEKMIKEKNLADVITLTGSMPPEKVREYMEKAEIFLATSDFQEGWGAVLNEGMNSGCALIASHAMGGAPYLIKDGENGLLYKSGDIKALADKAVFLLDNPENRRTSGKNAYETLQNTWNAEDAAKRLLALVSKADAAEKGPCSLAPVLKNFWYKE